MSSQVVLLVSQIYYSATNCVIFRLKCIISVFDCYNNTLNCIYIDTKCGHAIADYVMTQTICGMILKLIRNIFIHLYL